MQLSLTVEWPGGEPDEVYAGGPVVPDMRTFNRIASQAAVDHIVLTVRLRWYAAMTGAMRWPWSQEARIDGVYRADYA